MTWNWGRVKLTRHILTPLLILIALTIPGLGQQHQGLLQQTGNMPDSYVLTNAKELEYFVQLIPPVLPFKVLPAKPNPDPLLENFDINFEESILVIAVGRNRIQDGPVFQGVSQTEDGSRQANFRLPQLQADAQPFGWAVYSAVVLPRLDTPTVVKVEGPEKPEDWRNNKKFERMDFPRL